MELIDRDPAGVELLIVTIEDCDSCAKLHDDIAQIEAALGTDRIVCSLLQMQSEDELAAVNRLRLTDVPATYLFESGKVRGGWFGYDYDEEPERRVSNLTDKILAKRSSS